MNDYALSYSLETGMPINIMYIKGAEISQRQIQVRRIEGDTVIAYCHKKHAMRNFRKDNILAAMIPCVYSGTYSNIGIHAKM